MTLESSRILSPDERKLLKRLKLTLWMLTILFVIHGLGGLFRLRELYPITRWWMYSNISRGHVELREGYLIQFEIRAKDINGNEQRLRHARIGVPTTSGTGNLAADAVYAAYNAQDPAIQQVSRQYIFNRLEFIYGVPFEEVQIWRIMFAMDYDQFPYIDLATYSYDEYLTSFTQQSLLTETQNP
ncbi:MAG: hypothetical protein H7Y09_12125 [Chitinophagaceae bacterium]|nr:hypothetical protein [Anaerolineae bacterium]